MLPAEAIDFLCKLRRFGARPGLETTRRLAGFCGDPQERLRFVHVAGTNGKGSTCAMLEAICRASGLRTGLFTSPHLVRFSERMQVNRQPVSDDRAAELAAEMQSLQGRFPAGAQPTFFEVVTVMALNHFAAEGCELVVWETGMGGRLDATNIVTPLAAVITNVGLDHQRWLGGTIEEIAFEKAGIIKAGVPVITAAEEPAALEVIVRVAEANRAPLRRVTRADAGAGLLKNAAINLAGEHQRLNAATAVAAAHALAPAIPVSNGQILQGLANVCWPGRMQWVKRGEGGILIDGAHNVPSAEQFRQSLEPFFAGARPAIILGILADKDWERMCGILAPAASRIFAAPVQSDRTALPEQIQAACLKANPSIRVTAHPSLAGALEAASGEPLLAITGSLYLVGEAMELLGLSSAAATDERALNEWSQPPRSADEPQGLWPRINTDETRI